MPARLESGGNLKQNRRLPNTRLAADENHRAGNDAAAEHEVEFP